MRVFVDARQADGAPRPYAATLTQSRPSCAAITDATAKACVAGRKRGVGRNGSKWAGPSAFGRARPTTTFETFTTIPAAIALASAPSTATFIAFRSFAARPTTA